MARNKDYTVVVVVSDLTANQSATLQSEIMKAKNKVAPRGRGTAMCGRREDVGKMIQGGKYVGIERKK